MASRRLFALRPACLPSLPLPSARFRRGRADQHRGLAASAAAVVKGSNKKKKEPATVVSPDHLKKRTRSGAKFDRALYRRYADPVRDHVPVMLGEVLDAFRSLRLRSFVDCTLGAAGHSAAIVEAHPELELYVGMDMDASIHDQARTRIEKLLAVDSRGSKLKAYTHVRNFKYIKSVLGGVDENLLDVGVNGILMDLGISSMQVDDSTRGFSVQGDGPLDMRMNPQASLTAEEILNSWPAAEVGKVLREYGEESNWQFIQNQIVEARAQGGLHTTDELVHLVRRASSNSGGRQGWIKTATRVFQALRIAVNDELQTLEQALYACFDCLSSGGRLAVISFHSLEDRIVKQTFLDIIEMSDLEDDDSERPSVESMPEIETKDDEPWSKNRVQGKQGIILTKRPITATTEEEIMNRRVSGDGHRPQTIGPIYSLLHCTEFHMLDRMASRI
ncbi:ribosomal RNA small subunit methyltransferase H-like [Zingiber officinale]|uniref:MraW methylase family protein n=1 Tax=Zingiber officinale TaxID=94328 RepID=A0A8J5KQN2_ZINOF|nr:ribosomal RNA small subunit methyltransferase H-like [Zingiber officinale]KAG6488134.1 hypothetical protein ZIOFF_056892 [Zingiber officinale]